MSVTSLPPPPPPHDVSVTIKPRLSAVETLKLNLFHSLYRSVTLRTALAGDDVIKFTSSTKTASATANKTAQKIWSHQGASYSLKHIHHSIPNTCVLFIAITALFS